MQNWRLDDILSSQSNNMRLVEGLKLLKQRATLGSLASSDNLEFAELCQFRQISRLEIEDTITSIEPFPGEMMSLYMKPKLNHFEGRNGRNRVEMFRPKTP